MTHEPECNCALRPTDCEGDCEPHGKVICIDGQFECDYCGMACACFAIRAAYQRGREDAAKALSDVPPFAGLDEAIAAARGDGEQA